MAFHDVIFIGTDVHQLLSTSVEQSAMACYVNFFFFKPHELSVYFHFEAQGSIFLTCCKGV